MDDRAPSNLTPKRVAIFLTAVDDGELDETVAHIVEDAEARGMFFEWAAIGDMDVSDVANGTPLHKALTGQFPDR